MSKTITGTTTIGVTLTANSTIIDGDIITGEAHAIIGAAGKTWTLANHGTVASAQTQGTAIDIAGGLRLSNAAGADISGYFAGIYAKKSATISNAGTITTADGFAGAGILLLGRVNNSITNAAGGVISGADGVLFRNPSSSHAATILNEGVIRADGINLNDTGVILAGTLDNAKGGTIISQRDYAVALTGASTIIDAGLIENASNGAAIDLGGGAGAELVLQSGASIVGAVVDFLAGDTIDIAGVTITRETFVNGTLKLYDGKTVAETLQLGNAESPLALNTSAFSLQPDGHGGTDITLGAATFTGTYKTGLQLAALSNTVAATARINHGSTKIYGLNGSQARDWTLLNAGTIVGGVRLGGDYRGSDSTITNAAAGLIETTYTFGPAAINLYGGAVIDFGTIIGGIDIDNFSSYTKSPSTDTVGITLESGAVLKGSIANLLGGDFIDFAGLSITSETFADGIITLHHGTAVIEALAINGEYLTASSDFSLVSQGSAGTELVVVAGNGRFPAMQLLRPAAIPVAIPAAIPDAWSETFLVLPHPMAAPAPHPAIPNAAPMAWLPPHPTTPPSPVPTVTLHST